MDNSKLELHEMKHTYSYIYIWNERTKDQSKKDNNKHQSYVTQAHLFNMYVTPQPK